MSLTGSTDKSFLSYADAQAFVAGQNPSNTMDEPAKFYGLAGGANPGVYTDWAECQASMGGTKGVKYRKFATREEAEEFVKDWKSVGMKRKADDDDEESELVVEEDTPTAKKVKVTNEKSAVSSGKKSGYTKVYTDGSSLGNGQKGSSAGVGVFFGSNDPRYVSRILRYHVSLTDIETSQNHSLEKSKQISVPNSQP